MTTENGTPTEGRATRRQFLALAGATGAAALLATVPALPAAKGTTFAELQAAAALLDPEDYRALIAFMYAMLDRNQGYLTPTAAAEFDALKKPGDTRRDLDAMRAWLVDNFYLTDAGELGLMVRYSLYMLKGGAQ
jgi:hypothetical protein